MKQCNKEHKSSLVKCLPIAAAAGLLAYLGAKLLTGRKHRHRPAAPETKGITIRWASLYDPLVSFLLLLMGKKEGLTEATLEQVRLAPGDRVLDVGCGTGNLAMAAKGLVGPAGEVQGIDAAPEMIDVAGRKAAKAGVDVTFQVGLIEEIPFPDDQFDVVLSSLMVHHLPGDDLKRKSFAEIYRVLKSGGQLLVVDFELPPGRWLKPLTTLLLSHRMAENEVGRLPAMLEAAGFTRIEVGKTSLPVLSFVRGRAGEGQNGQS